MHGVSEGAAARPPSAEAQLDFLRKVQRVLGEGNFVATYKFALLHALADLAVQHGDDSGDELTLSVEQLAAAMIELYWRQSQRFPGAAGRQDAVLHQIHNQAKPAEIV